MKTRILSGLIMVPLLAILYFGGYVLMAACFLIGVMGVREFYKGFEAIGVKPSYWVAYVSAAGLYSIKLLTDESSPYMLWFFAVVILSLLSLFQIEKRKLDDAMATITGVFYIVFFSFHIAMIGMDKEYATLVWLVILTAFGTDIMAYFSGYLFGKHKLCPKISPKKTIEGAIGGVLGSVALCGVFGYFFTDGLWIHCLIIGFLGGIISQFGDLTASIFKRKMGIKDYGNLIPGHGGILDRFDSVLFTGPLVWYYIVIVLSGTVFTF